MDQLANDLVMSGRKISLSIKTLNGEFTSNSTALKGLKVASISEDNIEWLPLPRTFTRPDLPVDNDDITKLSQLRKWKYLGKCHRSADLFLVGLLVGANYRKVLNQLKSSKVEMVGPMHLKLDSVGVWWVR